MTKRVCRLIPLLFLACLALAAPLATMAAQSPYSVDDPTMGLYEGDWQVDQHKGKITAHVRALGRGAYEGFVLVLLQGQPVAIMEIKSAAGSRQGAVGFNGRYTPLSLGARLWTSTIEGEISGQVFRGKIIGGRIPEVSFTLSRVLKKSPTLGMKPPEGAIVLFSGKDTSEWATFPWKLVSGDAMEVAAGKGNLTTKRKLENYRLHLEFRVPFLPDAQGQERANSGVYIQSIYEVQILDSFGVLRVNDGDCGGIYGVQSPGSGFVFLPPMQWQTLEITFQKATAATGDLPTVTTYLNGTIIMRDTRIPQAKVAEGTGGGDRNGGLLMLQDHGHPVQFRNIWVEPLK